MSARILTRRRFISIAAVALAGARTASAGVLVPVRWRGRALGASASIELHVPDGDVGARLVERCVAEVRRLESVFSLYRGDSAVSRLNRDGGLDRPPPELVELAARAVAIGDASGGAFDITVQPLWKLYSEHFAARTDGKEGPEVADVRRIAARVDYRRVRAEPNVIAFESPGMEVTFNGIAQGFITDRVCALLARAGLVHVLVDLGEIRALGPHPSGRPWRVGVRAAADARTIQARLPLSGGAIATSAGAATRFGASERHHHLFDPHTGDSAAGVESVTVRAPNATLADALSTAVACAPAHRARDIIAPHRSASGVVRLPGGAVRAI